MNRRKTTHSRLIHFIIPGLLLLASACTTAVPTSTLAPTAAAIASALPPTEAATPMPAATTTIPTPTTDLPTPKTDSAPTEPPPEASATVTAAPEPAATLNPTPPDQPVKLIFVHHSTGGNWLASPDGEGRAGGLGQALMENNYYVSATNYDWGPDSIGSYTDIVNWPTWFLGPDRETITQALYKENGQNVGGMGDWPRLEVDPGGENEIILFKSCFPNSNLWGEPDDPPAAQISDEYSVANAKAIYIGLLDYFRTRPDKLFVVITAPPLSEGSYGVGDLNEAAKRAANARAFNNWLVNDWLTDYDYANIFVFDYYNVLTSNSSGGRVDDPDTMDEPNDLQAADGNHHRWNGTAIEHLQTIENDFSAYPSDTWGDSHPTSQGHQKATAEFVPLLNVAYHRWKGE